MKTLIGARMRLALALAMVAAMTAQAQAQSLGDFEAGMEPWQFGLGTEFKGANGSADVQGGDVHGGNAALRIAADFSGGGRYIHITRKVEPAVTAGGVELWVKTANVNYLLIRFKDESGQTFQPQVKLQDSADWQLVSVTKLNAGQHWGGANDGQWHGKLIEMSVLLEKGAIKNSAAQGAMLVDDIAVAGGTTAAQAVTPSAPATSVAAAPTPAAPPDADAVRDDFEQSEEGWKLSLGGEFPGAKGSLERTDLAAHEGTYSLKLTGDFTGGGRYVDISKNLDSPIDAQGVSLWIKPHEVKKVLVRVLDSTGQTFQHHLNVEPNDNWQHVTLPQLAGREKWGGANDGQWHGPLVRVSVLLERPAIVNGLSAWLHIDDIAIAVSGSASAQTLRLPVPLGMFADNLTGWWPLQDGNVNAELVIDQAEGHDQPGALRADVDYSGGGNWFTLLRQMDQPFDIGALRFWVKTDNLRAFNVMILTVTGQNITRPVQIAEPGQWQLVELADLPGGVTPIKPNESKLFGAAVAIRIGVDRAGLVNGKTPQATLWLDDAAAVALGQGILYVPGAALRAGDGLVARIAVPRAVPIFWGPQDQPTSVDVRFENQSDVAMPRPAVTLLDWRLRPVAVLDAGGESLQPGENWARTLPLQLPGFGHYTIRTTVAGQPLGARVAWVAAEGQPDIDGPLGVHHHLSQGPWGRSQYVGGGDAAIELTRKIGAAWVREDIRGSFSNDDRLITSNRHGFFGFADPARAQGLAMVGTYFDYFASNQPPADDAARQRYAKRFVELVKAYQDVVRVFEVWNEPNIAPGWRGEPNPEQYAALLAAAYPAIKQADPAATVLGVTSAGTDFSYIERVLKAGGGKNMDAISVHPYHGVAPELGNTHVDPRPVWMGTGDHITFVKRVQMVEELLDRHGAAGKPVWGTEMGSGNKDDAVEWFDTCCLIRQYLLGAALPRLKVQMDYNFQDQGYNEDEASHMTFGLVRGDGSPEPRLVAYNTLSRAIHQKRFVGAVDLGAGVLAYRFAGQGGDTLALWSVEEGRTASFATDAGTVTVMDLMGNERQVQPIQGRVTLAATGAPTFVRGAGPVQAAEPLITVTTKARATSEDRVAVTIDAASALKSSEVSGEAGPGWTVVEATSTQVVFLPEPALPSGKHTLSVRVGDMSAAADLMIDNAVRLTANCNDAGHIVVTVDDPFPNPRQVKLRPAAPGQKLEPLTLEVPGGSSAQATVQVSTRTAAGLTTVPVALNAALGKGELGYIALPAHGDRITAGVTPWLSVSPAMDGRLEEWPADQACVLDQAHQALPVGRFAKPTWGGASDLSGKFWIGSDAQCVYLALATRDDRHVQPFAAQDLWKGDSVQFALRYGEVRYEFTLGVKDDGQVVVRQDSPTKQMLTDFQAQAQRTDAGWQLELALPWRTIGVTDAINGPDAFALLINDNDEVNSSAQGGRKGYLEWFGGIGGDKKDPSLYGPIRRTQAAAMHPRTLIISPTRLGEGNPM
jgi:hypothetical protein